MRPVLVAVLALLVAPAALAAPPEGFRLSGPLTVRAAKVSGVPAATVYCGGYWAWRNASDAGWGTGAEAITDMTTQETFLRAGDCRTLHDWSRGRKVSPKQLGYAALTFTHEAMHLRGIANEGQAECRAMRELPRWLRTVFGVRKAATLRAVMRWARQAHQMTPASYQTVC